MIAGRPRALLLGATLVANCGVERHGGPPPSPPAQALPDAAPGTPPGVDIDGVRVPRERVIVFMHIGHSNMAGRAVNPPEMRPYFYDTHPRLWTFHWKDVIELAGPFTWRLAQEPLSPDSRNEGRAGPGMALLRAAMAVAPPDAYLVSIGRGQSGVLGGACPSFLRSGELHHAIRDPARALRGNVTFAGLFTMLGASEFLQPDGPPGAFLACMKTIAEEMRADLGEPDLPFIVGTWEHEAFGGFALDGDVARPIVPQLEMIPQVVPRSALIPTDGLPLEDDHHFNFIGHKGWADNAIEVLRDHGWAPWATAP
jgi:hypothetical protein